MTTSGQTWKDMMGLGGICSTPKDSREALCHIQTFSPDFTSLLPSFNIPSCPFPRRSRTPLHGQAQMCSRPPFSPGVTTQAHPQGGSSPRPALGAGELQWGAQRDSPAPAQHGGCRRMPALPGSPIPAVAPGLRDPPELPERSQQREPKGRGSWAPGHATARGGNGDCHPSVRFGNAPKPPSSRRTAQGNPACVSLREPPLSRGAAPPARALLQPVQGI